jgi:hypothetical protein
MGVPLQECPKSEYRLTCVRMQWVPWTNCALCPLLAVICGDTGLGLFTLTVSSPRMDCSAQFKNARSYAFTPPYITWHCTCRDNLTFTFHSCVRLMSYSFASATLSVTVVRSVRDACMYASLHSDARLYLPTPDACSSLRKWTVRNSHCHARKMGVKSCLGLINVTLWRRIGEWRYSSRQYKLCILPTQCIHVFRMVLTINSDYFPKQH